MEEEIKTTIDAPNQSPLGTDLILEFFENIN